MDLKVGRLHLAEHAQAVGAVVGIGAGGREYDRAHDLHKALRLMPLEHFFVQVLRDELRQPVVQKPVRKLPTVPVARGDRTVWSAAMERIVQPRSIDEYHDLHRPCR